jgi:hypothetical protein
MDYLGEWGVGGPGHSWAQGGGGEGVMVMATCDITSSRTMPEFIDSVFAQTIPKRSF